MHRRVAKFRKRVAGQLAVRALGAVKLPDEALACIQGNRASRRAALKAHAGRPPRTPRDRAFKGVAP
jgi:hypothetical protein